MAKSKAEYWLTSEGLTLLEGWARDGLTDEQIANNMGISTTSLYNYKNKYVEIFESLKKNKAIADYEVENALYKRAIGYEYEEETYEYGNLTKKVKKQVAPDTTAMIFWLKNRKPKSWKDKVITEDEEKDIQNAKNFVIKIKEVASSYGNNDRDK